MRVFAYAKLLSAREEARGHEGRHSGPRSIIRVISICETRMFAAIDGSASRLDKCIKGLGVPSAAEEAMLRNRLLILLGACFLLSSAALADDTGYIDCSNHP